MGALLRIGSPGAIWQNNYLTVQLLLVLTQMFRELMLPLPRFAFCWPEWILLPLAEGS